MSLRSTCVHCRFHDALDALHAALHEVRETTTPFFSAHELAQLRASIHAEVDAVLATAPRACELAPVSQAAAEVFNGWRRKRPER